jgi:ethanolamine ammonia-lyase large subunit
MNKYNVIAEMVMLAHISKEIEAENEEHAEDIMWNEHLNEEQRDDCYHIEINIVEETK